jgi:cobyrinic acid a,c-diamide synthase
LASRGLRVATFKCGPDYLDPTYHARATGLPCHNLDGWLMGRDAVRETFVRGARAADVSLIEGVMGLYDGAGPDSEAGSAAEIAKWLEAPVLAVVDAAGVARTLAALGRGLQAFDPALRLVGLFANRVGSRGHLDLLRSACAREIPVIGGLPVSNEIAFPERHLGLRTADRAAVPDALFAAWGGLIAEWCEPAALLALADSAPPLPQPEPHRPAQARACRLALARDEAFHFYYDDNLRRLEALGAELVPFSPRDDQALPPDIDGIYLGGGYPESHAEALSANTRMRQQVRDFAGPIYAECGGLMYLSAAIRGNDGCEHPMVGRVAGVAVMRERLQALGYVEVETQRPTVLGPAGLRIRGHQFRYSSLEGAPVEGLAYRVRRRRDSATHGEGYGDGRLLASYVHVHFASNPLAAEGLVASCRRFRDERGAG